MNGFMQNNMPNMGISSQIGQAFGLEMPQTQQLLPNVNGFNPNFNLIENNMNPTLATSNLNKNNFMPPMTQPLPSGNTQNTFNFKQKEAAPVNQVNNVNKYIYL